MSSLEITELTGKEHPKALNDVVNSAATARGQQRGNCYTAKMRAGLDKLAAASVPRNPSRNAWILGAAAPQ